MYKKDNDDFFVCKDYCEPLSEACIENAPKNETFYFEDLDNQIQEVIIDLLASIIKNS